MAQEADQETPLVPLNELLQATSATSLQQLERDLTTVSRTDLANMLATAIGRAAVATKYRIAAFYISAEMTKRGIPPVFQGLPELDEDDLTQRYDYCLFDLLWIVTRYPVHVVQYARYRGVFQPASFLRTADFIFYQGRRPVWQIVAGMTLTGDQQQECCSLHSRPVASARRKLRHTKDDADQRISDAVRKKDRRGSGDQEETIRRRQAIWFCAEIGGWKPQRTADLYEMHTGNAITRQLAAKQMDKVKDDLKKRNR